VFLKAFKSIKKSKKTTLPNKRFVINLRVPNRKAGLLVEKLGLLNQIWLQKD